MNDVPEFDLNTPDGGRGYIAELFKTVLKRHDYRQYIAERLAGDFACTLAQHFERITAERDALQLRLNASDQRIDELTGTSADRSPKDYAIEHAEYMAKSADHVLAEFQVYGLALIAVDEGGDDGEGELFEAIDSARQDLQEALVDLRSMVFEFRKRANRITPQ
ncbi:hypothetical protein [Pseudomonas sp. GM67]|uniref:hypothetical protein n=1 Tax=Pseudomonas sp. GM67 TaxID=1144335 RepID=UPI000270C388|nr:hypothetical protein [Pseudomonas sp. GM67]EJM92470.1 hypothetical protein PMI33_00727 [Pseudomonas sp. GM67]